MENNYTNEFEVICWGVPVCENLKGSMQEYNLPENIFLFKTKNQAFKVNCKTYDAILQLELYSEQSKLGQIARRRKIFAQHSCDLTCL